MKTPSRMYLVCEVYLRPYTNPNSATIIARAALASRAQSMQAADAWSHLRPFGYQIVLVVDSSGQVYCHWMRSPAGMTTLLPWGQWLESMLTDANRWALLRYAAEAANGEATEFLLDAPDEWAGENNG